jgi:hypothetical protein
MPPRDNLPCLVGSPVDRRGFFVVAVVPILFSYDDLASAAANLTLKAILPCLKTPSKALVPCDTAA